MPGALGVFQDLNQIGSTLALYSQDNITAWAGGGKTNAVQLTAQINRVTVVATAADSVKLPPAQPGLIIWLANADAADAMQVFGQGSDTINGVATGTGVSQAASGALIAYVCATSGAWVSIASSAAAITSGTIDNAIINNSSVGLTTAVSANFTVANVSSNLSAGNFALTGAAAITGNITSGNGAISGLLTGGNITTAGTLTAATANVAANFSVNGNIVPIVVRQHMTWANMANNMTVFIATTPVQVTGVKAVTANTTVSGNLMVEKLSGTGAPGSGVTLMTGTMNLAAGNRVVQMGTLNATVSSLQMTANDRLGLIFAGDVGNLLEGEIDITLKPI